MQCSVFLKMLQYKSIVRIDDGIAVPSQLLGRQQSNRHHENYRKTHLNSTISGPNLSNQLSNIAMLKSERVCTMYSTI